MKKTVLFSVLALTASVFADDGLVAAAKKMDNMSQQQTTNNNQMMSQVILTSARPESDNGWYVFADALYWHADVGNTDWSAKLPTDAGNPTQKTGTVHHLDFKWSWGFKVGIGVNMDHDMWDSNLYYTWFHTENSNSIGPTETQQDVVTWVPPGFSQLNSASHNWSIHFSMFDWELGRWYYVSKNLALRPHVGVKGGWINQERKTKASRTQDQQGALVTTHLDAQIKNNFWGVGPSIGLNTMWVLGNAGSNMDHRFSLFGDAAGSLMYGHFDNNDSFLLSSASSPTTSRFKYDNLSRNLAVAMLQGVMGLSWDTAFNRGRNHFMMKVGYEFQYWFRQNQFLYSFDFAEKSSMRYSDDLALQGLTVDFRFDF